MKITVYHGATEIIEAPLNHVGRPRLDFGQGFYVTDLKDQAIKWAKTIAEKRAAQPLLNIYTLDRDAILAEARCKIFTAYDKDWLAQKYDFYLNFQTFLPTFRTFTTIKDSFLLFF